MLTPLLSLLVVLAQLPSAGPSYRITASLDETAGVLEARAAIRYRNRFPDTLREIVADLPAGADLTDARVDGAPVTPVRSPVSASLRFTLPRPLFTGDSATLTLQWTARPTAAKGAEYEFAFWHPVLPGIGTILLRLDVPADEVVSAGAVPLCGDPGWTAARRPAGRTVTLRRDGYLNPRDSLARAIQAGVPACDSAGPGRKVVVWYAEDVPELAVAVSPVFRYEEGDFLEKPVRVFYPPGDERTWGAGLAVRRSETALAWLEELFGRYPWPQLTTVHWAGHQATHVPMQVWSDTPDQERLLHELGHLYTGTVLAVRDPAAEWLDEGLTRFQTSWFFETIGRFGDYARLERQVLDWDLDGLSEPIAQPRAAFRDSVTADAMIAYKGELFFHQLRASVGDEASRRIMRAYYREGALQTVDETVFRSVAERDAGRDFTTFFRQWLHETPLYDYRIAAVKRVALPDSHWSTMVDVAVRAPGVFPVEVWVLSDGDTVIARAPGRGARERLEVETRGRPRRILVDPLARSHDWNMLSNQKTFGVHPLALLSGGDRPALDYADTYFTRRSRRDRLTVGWAPTAWLNEVGGWTFGVRRRDDYLGRFELNEFYLTQSTGWGVPDGRTDLNGSLLLRNPVRLRGPGWSQHFGAVWAEGRVGASVGVEKTYRHSIADRTERVLGLSLAWLAVRMPAYLDRGFYDDAGTVELAGTGRLVDTTGRWTRRLTGALAGGYQYANPGASTPHDEPYARVVVSASALSGSRSRLHLGARGFAGLAVASGGALRQRLIYVAGADPYEQLRSPFLRSRGAILVRNGMHYHDPGGANARGLDPHLAARQAYGLNLEVEVDAVRHRRGLARRVALALFSDGVVADGDLDPAGLNRLFGVADAGVGVRASHRVGETAFATRFDFPLWVSRPELAQDRHPGAEPSGWRWTFSFAPAF